MRLRSIALALIATVAACESAGDGGGGGSMACSGTTTDVVSVIIAGSDGQAISSDVTAAVTVSTMDTCTTATCPSGIPGAAWGLDRMATRIVLTAADGSSWTVYLRYTAMPANLLQVGDAFDMTIKTSLEPFVVALLNQTIILAHGSDLVLFASNLSSGVALREPDLQAFGITVADAGACYGLEHAALVTVGTDSARVERGTTQIGWLTFTDAAFNGENSNGGSDIQSQTQMAGFRTP
jgi:hypothetical protein